MRWKRSRPRARRREPGAPRRRPAGATPRCAPDRSPGSPPSTPSPPGEGPGPRRGRPCGPPAEPAAAWPADPSASPAIRAIPSRSRPAPWTPARAPATAAARADDSPRPEPSGTRHCVTTRTPVCTPIACSTRTTVAGAPFRRASATSSPSILRSVSFDSIRTPATPVSTRHQGRRSMATVTLTAPGAPPARSTRQAAVPSAARAALGRSASVTRRPRTAAPTVSSRSPPFAAGRGPATSTGRGRRRTPR